MTTSEHNTHDLLNADDYPEIRGAGARGSLQYLVADLEHSNYRAYALGFTANSHRAATAITDMMTNKDYVYPVHIKAAANAQIIGENVDFAIMPRLYLALPRHSKAAETEMTRLPCGGTKATLIHKLAKIDNDYEYLTVRQSKKPKRYASAVAEENAKREEEVSRTRFVLIQPESYSEEDVARLWHRFLIKRLSIPISKRWSYLLWEYCKADKKGVKPLFVWSKNQIKAAYLCEPREAEMMSIISEMGREGVLDNLLMTDEEFQAQADRIAVPA